MTADKEDKFDEMLGRALRRHSEPVPADFTERILRQITKAEEQRILARVVMEERVALAGCVVLGIAVIIVAAVFPDITASLTGQMKVHIDKITHTITAVSIKAVNLEWQFYYTVFMGVFGLAVYSLLDLLVADSRQ